MFCMLSFSSAKIQKKIIWTRDLCLTNVCALSATHFNLQAKETAVPLQPHHLIFQLKSDTYFKIHEVRGRNFDTRFCGNWVSDNNPQISLHMETIDTTEIFCAWPRRKIKEAVSEKQKIVSKPRSVTLIFGVGSGTCSETLLMLVIISQIFWSQNRSDSWPWLTQKSRVSLHFLKIIFS